MKGMIIFMMLAGAALSIQTTGRMMQYDANNHGAETLPKNATDMDPCDMLMMPMVFEMGHDVIYLFRGYVSYC